MLFVVFVTWIDVHITSTLLARTDSRVYRSAGVYIGGIYVGDYHVDHVLDNIHGHYLLKGTPLGQILSVSDLTRYLVVDMVV